MYHSYFGLTEAPFSIAVNPRYLFMSPRHRDALAHLLYGVGAGGGFILLTGEVGTGKTTINRCLLQQLPDSADIAIVLNPALDSRDLLATVCEELRIELPGPNAGLKDLTDALHRYLLANHRAGRKTVLMIDEAQHLSFDVLEQIRLLTNLETSEEKLLHIILIGQPELAEKLSRPELRQLNQRITARFELGPLNAAETGAYIRHRLQVAGLPAGTQLFSDALTRAIHRESRGVPRLINLICDRMLLGAYGRNSTQLDRALLRRAAREVLGTAGAEHPYRRWLLPTLAVLAVLAVAGALWLLLQPGQPEPGGGNAPAIAQPAEEPPPEPDRLVDASSNPPPAIAERAEPEPVADWRLSPRAGAALFAQLYRAGRVAGSADPCAVTLGESLRCEQDELRSWNQLLASPGPALLALVDAQRFESTALLVGIDGDDAILGSPSGLHQRPLSALATEWTGGAWRLWRTPGGVQRSLQRGDQGEDVAAVAALFARLDGQSEPLTGTRFDARLEERVRLFQRQQGLRADGVMGENTLRALSLALGDTMSFAEAQARVLALSRGEP
jgi:general secretion pathway protein A